MTNITIKYLQAFYKNYIFNQNVFLTAKAPAYFYMMTQDLKYNHSKEYNKEEKPHIKSSLCECDHGDDLIFTFGVPLTSAKLIIDASFTQEEILFSEQWMKFLVNFATSGYDICFKDFLSSVSSFCYVFWIKLFFTIFHLHFKISSF